MFLTKHGTLPFGTPWHTNSSTSAPVYSRHPGIIRIIEACEPIPSTLLPGHDGRTLLFHRDRSQHNARQSCLRFLRALRVRAPFRCGRSVFDRINRLPCPFGNRAKYCWQACMETVCRPVKRSSFHDTLDSSAKR